MRNKYRYFGLVSLVFVATILLMNCQQSPFIKEINSAYDDPLNQSHDVSRAAAKFLPIGMDTKEALRFLQREGFEIVEFSNAGYKSFPEGEFKKYSEDDKNKPQQLGIPPNSQVIVYAAALTYERMKFFLAKRLDIYLSSHDQKVVSVGAYVFIDGI